jgi:hypothetical protein
MLHAFHTEIHKNCCILPSENSRSVYIELRAVESLPESQYTFYGEYTQYRHQCCFALCTPTSPQNWFNPSVPFIQIPRHFAVAVAVGCVICGAMNDGAKMLVCVKHSKRSRNSPFETDG